MVGFTDRFRSEGFFEVDGLLTPAELSKLSLRASEAAPDSAGDRRMLDRGWCRDLASQLLNICRYRRLVTGRFVGVLCTFFDKSADSNWGIRPHRDLAVPARTEPGLAGWKSKSTKQGIPHALAPRSLLEQMLSLRLNVDPSTSDNGALIVAPGSHLSDCDADPRHVVEGRPGGGLLMSPLTMHASRKSVSGAPRRVLHFLYGPRRIEGPAEWYYSI